MLAGLEAERLPAGTTLFDLGAQEPDNAGVTLACGALHEVQARRGGDMPAATGFTLGLTRRGQGVSGLERPLLWIRPEIADRELGRPDAPGLATLGLDFRQVILARAPDVAAALKAAEDGARCAGLGGLILELWGEPRALDLTATRRLALRAGQTGVTCFLLRASSQQAPTAVATRWQVAPALSTGLTAEAPGHSAFNVTLLRHRGGEGTRPVEGGSWNLEWDRETRSFRDLAPLSRAVVSVPAGRPTVPAAEPADITALRRTG